MRLPPQDKQVSRLACFRTRRTADAGFWSRVFPQSPLHYGLVAVLGVGTFLQSGFLVDSTSLFQSSQQTADLYLLAVRNEAQQGEQLLVNGTRLPVNWSIRDGRVGVADVSLWQLVGVELMDTRDPQRQPVRWFTDPVQRPLVLDAWNDGPFRYLDITPLAAAMNWRVAVTGGALQLQTDPAQVVNVRQGRQSWGDRFVIDLDRPATWQVTEQANGIEIAVDGTLALPTPPTGTTRPGNTYQSYQVTQRGAKTIIQIQGINGISPSAFTLPNPFRLVIDLRSEGVANRDIQWSPGIRWRSQLVSLPSGNFPVIWLEINPRQSGQQLRPIWANSSTQTGTAPLTTMARQWQAAAAINAGFFNRNNQLPLGAIRRETRWFSGPILNRGAIAWNDQGNLLLNRLTLRETVRTNQGATFPLFSLNSGYVGTGISRYTPEWGALYTPILDNETIITVRQGQVVDQRPGSVAGQGAIAIPPDGYLLVSRGNEAIASQLPPRTPLQLQQGSVPATFDPFPNIVAAGPLLVQNQQIVLNPGAEQFSTGFSQQQAVRSGIARTADGTLLLVATQNRIGGRGPSLAEMAQLMQRLGAVDALNLDGGSSTSLYLGGRLINRSPLTVARVHNGLGVFLPPAP